MTTVGDVMDRCARDWLEQADELWPRTVLTAPVTSVASTIEINTSLLGVEEVALLDTGVLVEVGSEQMIVRSVDGATLTVSRGTRGTVRTAHASGAEARIAPPHTRQAIFEAVADGIVGLHPPLFSLSNEVVEAGTNGITEIDEDATRVTEVRRLSDNVGVTFDDLGEYPDPDDSSSMIRAIRVFGSATDGELLVRYRGRFARPASTADTLASLGVNDEWARIVVLAAAIELTASKPLSPAAREYVTAQLRVEGYPYDAPQRIRDAMVALYEFRVARAAASLLSQHPMDVVYT